MDAAKGKVDPPPLLSLYLNCRNWGALPRSGGMGDQSYKQIWQMNTLANVYYTAEAWKSGKKMTPGQEKVMLWLVDIEVK